MPKKCKDFVFSIVLIALGSYVIYEGFHIYKKASTVPYKITEFTLSPGFLPVILGIALVFCSLILLIQSFKGEKFVEALKTRGRELKAWAKDSANSNVLNMTIGTLIMFIYTFFLMEWLPFWAASLIFLLIMFFVFKAGKWWKVIIVAVLVMALIVLLFKYGFGAALPE